MVSMGVDVKFNASYFKKLGLKGDYEKAIDRGVDHGLQETETVMKREVPRPGHGTGKYKPTGNLQRSLSKRKSGRCRGEIVSSLKNPAYWVFVNYGTGPHTITPKNGGYLVFENANGETVFAKEVHHPGMPANPFITRTVNKVIPKFQEFFLEEFRNAQITG